MKYICLALLMISLFLGGCGASHDPREGGFFGGIGGLSSGTYEARIQDREQRLGRLQQIQEELDAESQELEVQKTGLREQIELEKNQLAEMQKSTASLEQEISDLAADDAASEQLVSELKTRLKKLQEGLEKHESGISALDKLEGTHGHGTPEEMLDLRRRQLEEQRRNLQEEYELLLKLTLELSG